MRMVLLVDGRIHDEATCFPIIGIQLLGRRERALITHLPHHGDGLVLGAGSWGTDDQIAQPYLFFLGKLSMMQLLNRADEFLLSRLVDLLPS